MADKDDKAPGMMSEQALANTTEPDRSVSTSSGVDLASPQSQSPPASTPPPTSTAPATPPRDYARDASLLQYALPPAPLPPNQTIPNFLRFLATLIFWTGSLTGIAVFTYRSVVFPRLLLLSARLTSLQQHNNGIYDKLLVGLKAYAHRHPKLHPRAIATLNPSEPAKVATPAEPARASEEHKPLLEPGSTAETTYEAPDLTRDLRASLKVLAVELKTLKQPNTKTSPHDSGSARLLSSLDTLSSQVSAQSFYYSNQHISSAASMGPGGEHVSQAIHGTAVTQSPAINQCKSEIRAMKGLLLNRRNFGMLTGRNTRQT
ncbi:uncharacterized protein L969DRAFT_86232 [Mixia osmundae IAM 14324]|uniref:Peroxin-14 n=1 Tax=Mixia osmundae (strain CBS 9802 / IAM 14324 / JCM 22182 / KY 12970) TaxID=764103 RepID=G7DU67_MIXOS|nr:uncharacterized protein L969DRAFT_86232 [Mixia osmundae IAM 14324]KEI40994.1 hypothetical protein L969DRAFT_86232 [Mixia osmundae IAM 14324]GAA94127.1 hypothetical protein E5Q_00775 [Mixia osmundae IAM 14324]